MVHLIKYASQSFGRFRKSNPGSKGYSCGVLNSLRTIVIVILLTFHYYISTLLTIGRGVLKISNLVSLISLANLLQSSSSSNTMRAPESFKPEKNIFLGDTKGP